MSQETVTDGDREKLVAALRTGTVVSYWADRQPDLAAIISPNGDRTFAQLDTEANRLARALARRGLTAGDAVAVMVANRPEFAVVHAAAQRSGLRITPINWHLTPEEAAYIVSDCEAKAFVADARFAEVAADAARQAPSATVQLVVGGDIAGFESFDHVLASEDGAALAEPVIGTSMLYTSGTTGRPKGVHRPPAARLNNAGLPSFDHVPGESVHLSTGPLYHAAPLAFSLVGPLTAGVTVVLMDEWSASHALHLIERYQVTHSHMVPTMFHRLLALPAEVRGAADVSSLKLVLHGAAPCPVATKQAIIDWWGPVLVEYYAATEGTGTFVTSEEWRRKPGTVGRPHEEGHIRILGPDEQDLPPDEIGTVYLRAPENARFTYFNDAEKTEGSYVDNYYTLGDVGYLDADGYLFLTDRSTDLIISGGVNIYPAEVEATLLSHVAVGDAAVIGVPDPEWGESVLAVVEPRPGSEVGPELAEVLVQHCRSQLAGYKCPRKVEFVDQLPRADNGKLYKRRLREQYRAAFVTGGNGDGNAASG